MARGTQLFASLFTEIETPVLTAVRKGRSEAHNERRNEALLARFYWYGAFTDLRLTKIHEHLANEFFLSERTVQDIIQTEYRILKRLRAEQPALSWFKREWPHLVWNL